MKRILIATYLIAGLILAGDFQAITPQGPAFGHVYPNGDFIVHTPASPKAVPLNPYYPQSPTNSYTPSQPSTTFGSRDGNTYTIITPDGITFGQGSK